MDHRSMELVILEREAITSRGSLIRKQLENPSIHDKSESRGTWWHMCFWYQISFPPGTGPFSMEVTEEKSVSYFLRTSSAPG